MEKRRPHHNLVLFKKATEDEKTVISAIAAENAVTLGLDIPTTVCVTERQHFHKSMTSYDDHTQWQDVYHVPITEDLIVYLKFTDDAIYEFRILSFKEK